MPDCDGQTHHATLTVGPSRQAALGPRRKARGAEGQRRERVGATRRGRGGCASRAWGAQLAGAARTKLRGPRGLEDKTVTSHRPWARQPAVEGPPGPRSSEASLLGSQLPPSRGLPRAGPCPDPLVLHEHQADGPSPQRPLRLRFNSAMSFKTLSPNTTSF